MMMMEVSQWVRVFHGDVELLHEALLSVPHFVASGNPGACSRVNLELTCSHPVLE